MSYSLSLYLVDPSTVRSAVGSGDDKLRRMIGGRFKSRMAHDDQWFASEIAEGAPTRYEALRAVIAGGPFEEPSAFQYTYAYQMVCEFHGRFLDNSSFSPFRGSWLEEVEKGMAALGMTAVELTDFSYGSPPSPLPRPVEVPGYGEWSAADCAEALRQWRASTPEQRDRLDDEVLRAVESVVGWLEAAEAKEGAGVVGFFF
ncbi:hypothetical protein GCM10010329_72920 [Streptomyces spiroverticillatus]|uniref:DUF7691 domain-containing protein n=1 Tax=Streptomyces finlayi TaxID=67296 RepID=A0A919CE06_9ACTN|nr:hypothetical protein [Streptomyces finlayi]GHA39258.1 hypothetical protein GCM10010329_72920 [Streptomyces spiroverticillatus]GHD14149.1 hypothetical protein GCM10010334_73080 [Streptomyces finlayi]